MYFLRSYRKINPIYFIIILLTLISYQIISERIIFPDVPKRIEIQNLILSGQMEAPYQYRIMKPLLGHSLQSVISVFEKDPIKLHTLSYQIIIFFVFLGIYFLFYFFLKLFFSDISCMIGLLMLCTVIPLGITSIWEDGDYYTLFFYLIGLNLIFRSKDYFLPLVIAIGTFNREQIIFLIVFYACYALRRNILFKKKNLVIIISSTILWICVYYLPRFIYGFKETKYTINWNVSFNLIFLPQILELWLAQVFIFVVLCIIAYKKSDKFFRYAFISLGLYVIIFFFFGFLTQMAKFLPAYLILIPMSLQVLTKEFTSNDSKINFSVEAA